MFRPYRKLVEILLLGRPVAVPENNPLLRGLQYLTPERIACGRFCWNRECLNCRVRYDLGEGTAQRSGLACHLRVAEGMRILEISAELRYSLRDLAKSDEPGRSADQPDS
jgi:hypothetical protein